MENTNFNESADNAAWNDIDKSDERLDGIKKEAATTTSAIGEDIVAEVMGTMALAQAKTGNFVKDNRNLIGGGLGLALAVGLELISPTGSKKSAIVACVAGGAVLAIAAPVLKAAPQSNMVASSAGIVTAYVGMCGGRITADYFPGNLSDDE